MNQRIQSSVKGASVPLLDRVRIALDTAKDIDVDAELITRSPYQPREEDSPAFRADALARLAVAIAKSGQSDRGKLRKKPGTNKFGKTEYELIDGERRWRAILSLPKEDRPPYRARLLVADDEVAELLAKTTNFNRESHTTHETIKTIDRCIKLGLTYEEAAEQLDMSQHWAERLHKLLKGLDPQVFQMLHHRYEPPRGGKRFGINAAIFLMEKVPKERQLVEAKKLVSRKMTVEQIRRKVRQNEERTGISKTPLVFAPPRQLERLENKLAAAAGLLRDAESIMTSTEVHQLLGIEERRRTDVMRNIRIIESSTDSVLTAMTKIIDKAK